MSEIGRQVADNAAGDERDTAPPTDSVATIGQSGDESTRQTGGEKPDAGDDKAAALAARVEALEASLAAERKKAEDAAKAAEDAKLSAEERQAKALAEQTEALEAERAKLRADRLSNELDKRRIAPKFRRFLGDVDPATDEGRKAIEQFVADYPEAVERDASDVAPPPLEINDETAKRMGTTKRALQATIANWKAIGWSSEKIAQSLREIGGGR
jgi:hypothetical protein